MSAYIKPIKNERDHEEALALLSDLMNKNPKPDTDDGEKLELLATLIQDYESKTIPESLPDPIDAILFRMEQQNLKASDLVPYIGSRSKVSEILSRKRPLTLSMIRALEAGLGIPAKVLLKESDDFRNMNEIAWNRFPLKEMQKRGYFSHHTSHTNDLASAVKEFLHSVNLQTQFNGMLRKTNYRSVRPMDKYALVAWTARVIQKAKTIEDIATYKKGTIDLDFMKRVAQLSINEKGPILVRDFLKESGIILVIEPHLPHTYLDGAALVGADGLQPIIGLTLRFDRLDNFWFTLMHELAHISLHSDQNHNFFYDDLDNPDPDNKQEEEADALASEALVPRSTWENSPAKLIPSPIAAESLARDLGIHVAIVAGKMRKEEGKYIYLTKIINEAKARKYFADEKWDLK
jgi:HTH-type transcriptional regulator / antitoxin HigA